MHANSGLSLRQRVVFGLAVVGMCTTALASGWRLLLMSRTAAPRRLLEIRDPRYPCGNVSIATISHLLDRPVTLSQTARALPVDPEGVSSLLEVQQALEELGLAARGVNFPRPAELALSTRPAILHVRGQHFVVAMPAAGGRVVILDPPRMPRVYEPSELRDQWQGACLLVSSSAHEIDEFLHALGLGSAHAAVMGR